MRIFLNVLAFICKVHIVCPKRLFCDGGSLLECYTVLTPYNIPEELNVESHHRCGAAVAGGSVEVVSVTCVTYQDIYDLKLLWCLYAVQVFVVGNQP